jgi:hypothetical protein
MVAATPPPAANNRANPSANTTFLMFASKSATGAASRHRWDTGEGDSRGTTDRQREG